ncbi:MAG: DUF6754 domain-containing protein [Anaerolineae bacterium]
MNVANGALEELVGFLIFMILIAAFVYFLWRVAANRSLPLRPIAAYDALKNLLSRAAEAGKPVHISIGTAGAGDATTVDTTAGLYALEFLADRAAVSAIPPIVTVSDPTALPVAQDRLRRSYQRQGYPEEYDPRQVREIAPSVYGSTVAYGAGVMDVLTHERVMANVMIGTFGDEFLLIGETGAQLGLLQAGGTSKTQVLPFVYTSITHPVIGEEIYAAGAYLSGRRTHIASLLAQDTVRGAIVIIVVLLALVHWAGLI